MGWSGVAREQFSKDGSTDGVRGRFYGDPSQLFAQLLAAGMLLAFGFSMAFAWFKLSNLIVPMRIDLTAEPENCAATEL